MITRIKFFGGRDALIALDGGRPPAEPVLEAVHADILPRGVTGAELAEMEEGWAVLLTEGALAPEELDRYAEARGGTLFRLGLRLLETGSSPEQEKAGEAWALADLGRHSGEPDAAAALEAARLRALPRSWPKPSRPFGMLALLARRDAERGAPPEPQGSPGRMWRMLRHRLTGR